MDNEIKILVVDDEERIRRLLKMYLEREGYQIDEAEDGNEAILKASANDYDLILLDIMMPGKDGIEVCRELREKKSTPVIMLTAKGEEINRVQGFEAGTDDYIVKPFEMREVIARVNAVMRRTLSTESVNTHSVSFDNLFINLDNYQLYLRGKLVDVPPKEIELLYFLASNPHKVFTREQLLDHVWGFEYTGDTRTVDVHIKRLREKLDGVSNRWMLKTVWGVGYKFELVNL